VRLRKHPEPGKNVQDPIGHEDSSAAYRRGCKVRVEPGNHHRPSRRSRIRGNPKTWSGTAVDAAIGATRGCGDGAAGRCEIRGNPEIHQSAQPEGQESGETRRLIPRQARATAAGAPRRLSPRPGRKERIRGDPKTHRRQAGRLGRRGNPEPQSEEELEKRGDGAT